MGEKEGSQVWSSSVTNNSTREVGEVVEHMPDLLTGVRLRPMPLIHRR